MLDGLSGRDSQRRSAAHERWRTSSRRISTGASRTASPSISLTRPERKNPLTFESYAELRDTFRALAYADDVKVVVFASNGGNFCSGGDVHDIIGPLLDRDMKGLLTFTRMTGDLVKAMLACRSRSSPRSMASASAPAR